MVLSTEAVSETRMPDNPQPAKIEPVYIVAADERKYTLITDKTPMPRRDDEKANSHLMNGYSIEFIGTAFAENETGEFEFGHIQLVRDGIKLLDVWVDPYHLTNRLLLFDDIAPKLLDCGEDEMTIARMKADYVHYITDIKYCLGRAKMGKGFESGAQKEDFLGALFESEIKINKVTKEPETVYSLKYHVAAEVICSIFHPVTFMDNLYVYESGTHIYQEGKTVVRSWISDFLDYLSGKAYSQDFKILPESSKKTKDIDEIYSKVFLSNPIKGNISPFNRFQGVPVKNGVIVFDVEKGGIELVSYKPEMMFTTQLPVSFTQSAETDTIKEILKDWSPDEYEVLIQIPAQAIAQSLEGVQPYKKCYMIVGKQNSGKTTYLDMLTDIFGEENISIVAPQDLGKQFTNAALVGKFMNIKDEMPVFELKDVEALKARVSNKKFAIEPKYGKQYVDDITAVQVFAGNNLPTIDPRSLEDDSFIEKVDIINFNKEYEQDANWKGENLTAETIAGFFVLIILMVLELLKTGKLPHKQEIQETRARWNRQKSPVALFLKLHTVRDPIGQIMKDEFEKGLHSFVKNYEGTEEEKRFMTAKMPKTTTSLTKVLSSYGISTGRNSTGNRETTFTGIKWKRDSIYNPDISNVKNWTIED